MNSEHIVSSILKEAFERPETGVFYFIPDIKSKKFTILSSFDNSEDFQEDFQEDLYNLHITLWDKVINILRIRFKKSVVEILSDSYRGLPRGRVTVSGSNWLVTHGGDFSVNEYKMDIISEFKLRDAHSLGKVKFEHSYHESMTSTDKKQVEKVLKIELSPSGLK